MTYRSKKETVRVKSIERLNGDVFRLKLSSRVLADESKPGQFVNIRCGGYDAYLRRPFSICDVNRTEGVADIVFQVKGVGTALLAEFKPGDEVDVMGPLGNGFDLFGLFDNDAEVQAAGNDSGDAERRQPGVCESFISNYRIAIVGGGIGVFPLLFLAKTALSNDGADKTVPEVDVFLGYRDSNAAVLLSEFAALRVNLIITSEDGSTGHKGYATDPFEQACKERRMGYYDNDVEERPAYDAVFACGPEPMLAAVARICKSYSLYGQVSVEQRMACGVGACLVCACDVRSRFDEGITYKHVCKDGPVFRVSEVVFDS